MGLNALRIGGELIEIAPLRHTPAGVPVVSGVLHHESLQSEAGAERQVEVELEWVAVGEVAKLLRSVLPGAEVVAEGFFAARSRRSKWPILHLNKIEFVEGKDHGFQQAQA